MGKYTAEDFAKERFAEWGASTAHRHNGLWYTGPDGALYDHEMANYGWTPVQEQSELTIDTLREAWVTAEVITEDNLPCEGDTLIRGVGAVEVSVYLAGHDWSYLIDRGCRILRRAPRRPDGAEELEDLLLQADNERGTGVDYSEMADWLTEHGVKVVNSD